MSLFIPELLRPVSAVSQVCLCCEPCCLDSIGGAAPPPRRPPLAPVLFQVPILFGVTSVRALRASSFFSFCISSAVRALRTLWPQRALRPPL